jgi:hypothetical protein
MSLQIDPNSVHLGKNAGVVDNIYIASYVGATGATGSCVLPPEIPYTPGNSSLIPLQPSCTFNFTDVLEIPPIPTPPPPASFRGCETLSASVDLITTEATKKTSLSLVAGGPFPGDTGTNDCTLKLVGIVDIDACTNFTATSAVNFNNAAAGSFLTIIPKSIPDCGFDLRGSININACENFTATSNITFNNALRGSYLTLTPSSLPNCGLDISGNLDVNACETFSATSSVSFRGNAVKKSSFSVSPTSTPNCGFTLNGDVVIDACTDFSASGGINFSGKAVKSSSVTVTAAQQPNCGLVLSGNVEIDACATFTAISNLKIYGQAVSTITPLSILSIGTPDCGFILNGELSIDACASASIEIVPDNLYPSYITLYTNVPKGQPPDQGEAFSFSQMILRSRPLAQSGCDSVVAMSIDPIDLAIPSECCPIVKPYTPGRLTGCCWDEDANGPFLYKDEYTNEMYIGGNLPIPCFVCDTTITAPGTMPFVFSDLTLNSLAVNYLEGTSCCTSPTDNRINLCNGIIQFTNTSNNTQLSADSATINLLAGYGGNTQLKGANLVLSEPYKAADFTPSYIQLLDTSQANTYLYTTADSLYYTNAAGSEATVTASYFLIDRANGDFAQMNASGLKTETAAGAYSWLYPYELFMDQGPSSGLYSLLRPDSLTIANTANLFSEIKHNNIRVQGGPDSWAQFVTDMDYNGMQATSLTAPSTWAYLTSTEILVQTSASTYSAMDADTVGVVDGNMYCQMKPDNLTVADGNGNYSDVRPTYIRAVDSAGYARISGTALTMYSPGQKAPYAVIDKSGVEVFSSTYTYSELTDTKLKLRGDRYNWIELNGSTCSMDIVSDEFITTLDFSGAAGYTLLKLTQVSVCVGGVNKPAWVFMQ